MSEQPLYPLAFTPFLRPMPWGGQRLSRWLEGAGFGGEAIGEAWLLSDHALHASSVSSGPLTGVTLRQLMETRSEEVLGRKADRFPFLIKLLDAREHLSIQIHPDDADAKRWAPREGGKTEAWLVLESDPEAFILLGLKPGINRTAVSRELRTGALPMCLQRYVPQPGECYFVPAGAIHALGGGLVVLEVQQTSDATFRLYDWGRVDAQGRPRPLHHEASLACLKEQHERIGPQQPVTLVDGTEQLVECAYFRMVRQRLTNPVNVSGPVILVGIEGRARVSHAAGTAELASGGAVLVPACLLETRVEPDGDCRLIQVGVPSQ
jgi:mannose-6-phosphate isomerase